MKLIKIPFSGGGLGKGNGSNEAPNKIISFLDTTSFEIEEIPVEESNISLSHKNIENFISNLNQKAILLGGDHSITYPSVKGFSKNNKDFKLLIFDAHPDLVNNFVPPTHEDYLKVLIEKKIIPPQNILLVGIRNSDKIETEYICKKLIHCIYMSDIKSQDLNTITQQLISFCDQPTYLSIDIDVFDSDIAPGTGYAEPNGFKQKDLFNILQKIIQTKNIKLIDIVEVNPKKDIENKTSFLASKLIQTLQEF